MKIPNQIDLIDRDALVDAVMEHWALDDEDKILFKEIIFKQQVKAVLKLKYDLEVLV